MIYSFDIFDTCLVRKCGTPYNMLDVLSLRVFKKPVDERTRQEFVASRRCAEDTLWAADPYLKLSDIYAAMDFGHEDLLPSVELERIETELEKELLAPVTSMRDRIDVLRSRGHHIIYISDMYLPDALIREKMCECGFLRDGDTLYVSNEVGRRKSDGSLFEYVRAKEGLHKSRWVHTGDDLHNDYEVPRGLGIRSRRVSWKYGPYPGKWIGTDCGTGFKYKSVMAGLSRALRLADRDDAYHDMVLDVVAPFYVPWVWRIMEQACRDGVSRLYFCARDAFQIHKTALRLQPWFPEIKKIEYLYISREALYKEDNSEYKLGYFERIGLADTSGGAAIVDITTSGKTLSYLNEFLSKHGCHSVKGYYFLLWNKDSGTDVSDLSSEVYDAYARQSPATFQLQYYKNLYVIENFFALNDERRTVDYDSHGPVLSQQIGIEEVKPASDTALVAVHQDLLEKYAECYASMGLGRFNTYCFEQVSIPNLSEFLSVPDKHYVQALSRVKMTVSGGAVKPFVKKHGLWFLFVHKKHDYVWRRGTVAYSLPRHLMALYMRFRKKSEGAYE